MSSEKRKVTFDPELQPSSESTPPDLPLAQYPPIVSQLILEDIKDPTICRSILKNPPIDDKGYESLCNFLIDLPPPAEDGLLSLDILQIETVFKPRNRFDDLKTEHTRIPVIEEDNSSAEYSDEDSFTEDNFTDKSNVQDIINEEDHIFRQTLVKPQSFEASLILQLPSDDRLGFSDFEINNDNNSLSPNISENENLWISDTNVNSILETSNSDAAFTDETKVTETDLQLIPVIKEIIHKHTIKDNTSDLEDLRTEFENCTNNGEWPSIDKSVNISIVKEICIDKRIYQDSSEKNSLENELEKVEYINPNIRKLNEEGNDLFEDFETVNKKNKITNDYAALETTDQSTDIGDNISKETLNREIQYDKIDQNIYNTNQESDLKDLQTLAQDKYIEAPSPPSPIEVDPSFILSEPSVANETNTTSPYSNSHEVLNNITSNKLLINTKTVEEVPNVPALSNNSEICESSTTTRQRRKSGGRKGHRKHSHGSRSVPTIQQENNCNNITNNNTSTLTTTADQKTLDAQARFKRYLGKMSVKAMNENQNLNYAGEPESLEPHMVSLFIL